VRKHPPRLPEQLTPGRSQQADVLTPVWHQPGERVAQVRRTCGISHTVEASPAQPRVELDAGPPSPRSRIVESRDGRGAVGRQSRWGRFHRPADADRSPEFVPASAGNMGCCRRGGCGRFSCRDRESLSSGLWPASARGRRIRWRSINRGGWLPGLELGGRFRLSLAVRRL
jgi:hypothetical protein